MIKYYFTNGYILTKTYYIANYVIERIEIEQNCKCYYIEDLTNVI